MPTMAIVYHTILIKVKHEGHENGLWIARVNATSTVDYFCKTVKFTGARLTRVINFDTLPAMNKRVIRTEEAKEAISLMAAGVNKDEACTSR